MKLYVGHLLGDNWIHKILTKPRGSECLVLHEPGSVRCKSTISVLCNFTGSVLRYSSGNVLCDSTGSVLCNTT